MSGRAWVVAALLLFAPRNAHAEDAKAFRLAFDAPADCPGAGDMVARIQASSPRARLASPIEPAVDLGAQVCSLRPPGELMFPRTAPDHIFRPKPR